MTNAKRASRWIAGVLVLAVWVGGCSGDGDDPTGPSTPSPGKLKVSLSTPTGGGSAFLLTVTGDSITNPSAVKSGHTLYSSIENQTLTAAIIGSASSGAILEFRVPDVNAKNAYSVTLDQVADGSNELLPTNNFSLSITE